MSPTPPAEVELDTGLVRELLTDQHPDLAGLPLHPVANGWDNSTFRLGDDLAVRLPRRALAAGLIAAEQRWLPVVAGLCPLPVPAPVRIGVPSARFGWPWSVVPWFAGRPVARTPVAGRTAWAGALADALTGLHVPAPEDAPVSPVFRGAVLTDRPGGFRDRLDTGVLDGLAPAARTRADALWQAALDAPAWPGPPLWLHADPHPANLVARDGALAALIDFGDMTAGDPACDLATAWLTFDAAGRAAFRTRVDRGFVPGREDPGLWVRAAGWAVSMASSMYGADPESDPVILAIGRHAVRELLG